MALIWLLGSRLHYVQLRRASWCSEVKKKWFQKHGCSGADLIIPFIVCMLAELEVFKHALMGVSLLQLKQCVMTCFCPVCTVNVLIWQITNFSLINIVTRLNPVQSNVLAIILSHLIQYGLLLCPKVVLPNLLTADWCRTPSAHLANRSLVTTQRPECLSSASNIPSATCCASQLMASSCISGFSFTKTVYF